MFAEFGQEQQNLGFMDGGAAELSTVPADVRKPGVDERHWLELNLYQLEAGVRLAGKEAMLYCGACKSSIAYGNVVPGPVQDWPYCPVHQDKALMVCSASLRLQDCQERRLPHDSDLRVTLEPGSVAEQVSSD